MSRLHPVSSASAGPRVLLVNPPVYDFAFYDLYARPLGLMRLGRWFEAAGYEVTFLDYLNPDEPTSVAALGRPKRAGREAGGPGRGKVFRTPVASPAAVSHVPRRFSRYGMVPEAAAEVICAVAPDLVAVATGMTYWYPGATEAAAAVRRWSSRVPMVAGGVYATLMPDHCAASLGTDHVVAGAAEATLPSVLRELRLPVPAVTVPAAPPPRPTWHNGAGVIKLRDGCPYRCDYCASGLLAPCVVVHPLDQWIAYVDAMVAAGVRDFAFYDDALLVRPQTSLVPLLQHVITRYGERALRFYVPNAVHVNRITPEIAALCYAAGFREMRLGVESTDAAFHTEHDGKLDSDELAGAVASLRVAGFSAGHITAYVLAGIPGQQAAAVLRTIESVRRLRIRVSISEYAPVPGTPLFEQLATTTDLQLETEPLLHNNTAFAAASSSFGRSDLELIKAEGRAANAGVSKNDDDRAAAARRGSGHGSTVAV